MRPWAETMELTPPLIIGYAGVTCVKHTAHQCRMLLHPSVVPGTAPLLCTVYVTSRKTALERPAPTSRREGPSGRLGDGLVG